MSACLARFPTQAPSPDTVHCFLAELPAGVALSDTLLRTVLDSAQFEKLHFGTGEARFWAVRQFPFVEGHRAALLQTEEAWFGRQNLLIFDLQQQQCVAVVEVSHFYGGDGGQTASESWLFRGKTFPQLFVKMAEHGIIPPTDDAQEPQTYLRESSQLFAWKDRQFRPIPQPDSIGWLEKYSMHRTW